MNFDQTTIDMLLNGIWETVYMVSLSSFLSYVIGIPVGIALVVTDRDGICPFPLFNKVLGVVINLLRSIPFIILLVMVIPFTRMIVGKIIGPNAAVVPLVISAFPYISRMVESSLKEVDAGVIEAAKSMGASAGTDYMEGTSSRGKAIPFSGSGHFHYNDHRLLCHGRYGRCRRSGRYCDPLRLPQI